MAIQAPTQRQIQDAWDTIAPGFDEFVTPQNIKCGQEMMRRADIGPGTAFLDVAAGSGALSIPAARRGADVVATDISPTMIERLAARARSEGLSNLDGRVMDGYALDFADDTFDVCASQHGVSLFPDLARGLVEMRRVAKPGGSVLVVAFGSLQKAENLGFFVSAIRAAVPGAPALPAGPPPLPFQLADPDVFRGALVESGLAEVSVETVTWDIQVESAEKLWKTVSASHPIGAGLDAGLTEDQRSEARQVLAGMLRERSGGRRRAAVHVEINIGVGRK